jgi:hypothetical protein
LTESPSESREDSGFSVSSFDMVLSRGVRGVLQRLRVLDDADSKPVLETPSVQIKKFGADIPTRDHSERLSLIHQSNGNGLREPVFSMQEQSPFFRLPAELRIQIYSYIISGHVFHLTHYRRQRSDQYSTLEHILCSYEGELALDLLQHACWGEEKVYNTWGDPLCCLDRYTGRNCSFSLKRASILPYLLTCRRMCVQWRVLLGSRLTFCRYSDTIDILYSTNVFDIRNLGTLTYLSKSLPLDHFQTIRSLQISWDMYWMVTMYPGDTIRPERPAPHDWDTWTSFWERVSTMSGLRSVRCDIEGLASSWRTVPEILLAPLLLVKQVPEFLVVYLRPREFDVPGRQRRDGILKWCIDQKAPFRLEQINTDAMLERRALMRQIAQKENIRIE